MPEIDIPLSLMRPLSGRYADAVADAAIPLLAVRGAGGVTLRSLADAMQMTPQGVRRWFGSIDGTWEAIALTFGQRWVRWLDCSEVAATRAWLSLCELARHNDELARVLAPWLEHETRTIGRLAASSLAKGAREGLDETPAQLLPNDLIAVEAVVHGLRQQMVRRTDPLGIEDAQEALRKALAALLLPIHSRA